MTLSCTQTQRAGGAQRRRFRTQLYIWEACASVYSRRRRRRRLLVSRLRSHCSSCRRQGGRMRQQGGTGCAATFGPCLLLYLPLAPSRGPWGRLGSVSKATATSPTHSLLRLHARSCPPLQLVTGHRLCPRFWCTRPAAASQRTEPGSARLAPPFFLLARRARSPLLLDLMYVASPGQGTLLAGALEPTHPNSTQRGRPRPSSPRPLWRLARERGLLAPACGHDWIIV